MLLKVSNEEAPSRCYLAVLMQRKPAPVADWKLEVVSSAVTPPGFARAAVKFDQRKCEKSRSKLSMRCAVKSRS